VEELLVATLFFSCLLFWLLFRASYRGGMISHNTRKVLFLSFVLSLVRFKLLWRND
jgi:hypothetical protein